MKKVHYLLTLLVAGSAMASTLPDYPVVYSPEAGGPVPNPAYAGQSAAVTTTTTYAQGTLGRFTLDVNTGYGFNAAPDSKFSCDIVSLDLEGAWYFLPHHALTLSLGYAGGGRTDNYWVRDRHGYVPFTDSYDRDSFTLMGGYRYSHMLGSYVLLQFGGKCGMDVQTIDMDYGYGWRYEPYDYHDGQNDTKVGMAYAGYVWLGFFVSQNTCVHVGYQYKGSTAKPAPSSGYPDVPDFRSHSMRWHEVRFGITMHF